MIMLTFMSDNDCLNDLHKDRVLSAKLHKVSSEVKVCVSDKGTMNEKSGME